MAPLIEDDEFGLSSGDEAELLDLASSMEQKASHKRKSPFDDLLPAKRTAIDTKRLALATTALTQNFGLQAFRLQQEQVISTLLDGESAAVVFPTGGGKSLCYQIPALVFSDVDTLSNIRGGGESGVTLVVSPLIALMKDQVDALVRRGIRGAAVMDSTKSREEYLEIVERLRNGELKLLYVAPERLNNEGFVEQMKHVRGGVRLLAVDEAHCISEWGHAFRPDYLKVSRFAEEIQAERVVCLTATATPRVAQDICKAFNIDEKVGLFRTSTYRSNLQLLAESGLTKKELYPRLCKFLEENPGPSIVYVTLQKQTEELAAELTRKGFKAKSFHAGMDTSVKTMIQEDFMRRNDLIIVATIAFGMGIDKANIRNVVHYNIPSSLESYSQEIGRAGRDGKTSKCMFYVCGEDLHLREIFARGDLPSKESVRGVIGDIFDSTTMSLPIGGEIKRSLYTQGKDYDIRATTLSNIYAQLELTHGLIRATTPMYTKYTFTPGAQYKSKIESDKSPGAIAINAFAKKASKLWHVDVDAAAVRYQIPRTDIVRKLNDLNESRAIELKPAGVINVFKIVKAPPKSPTEIDMITKSIHEIMVKREQEALVRTDQMLQLITGEACFTRVLAQHFGDDLPDDKEECGHCTWCMTHLAVKQQVAPPLMFNYAAFKAVLDKVPDRDDARFLARVAFGITSPRSTAMKLGRDPVFGSLDDHAFIV
ncbi:ATP-dependent DNA helicase [Lachnellula hyalina]|uniref:ATP-dependent DNA helicase n=1 Tax=Lachnellula hyalina TaxID=1316788 RepID=A0A8H8QUW1_9HELO|nr:ATP-dependent DNA helicase [Lachnellula hyalina]TVY22595.1 ATP-dependent DNA helicase [Lachnellula hyalina]